jgi:hypothetical protein
MMAPTKNIWFSITLGDGLTAEMPCRDIETAFLALFIKAGKPCDMAVFTRYDSAAHVHCEVTAYFSPAAAELAEMFDAQPCAKPTAEGLDLLAGDKNCWLVLFAMK